MPGPLSGLYPRSIPLHFPTLIVRVGTQQGERAHSGQRCALTWKALVNFLHIGTVVSCVGFVFDLLFHPAIREALHCFSAFALLGRAHAALLERHLPAAGQAHCEPHSIADHCIQGLPLDLVVAARFCAPTAETMSLRPRTSQTDTPNSARAHTHSRAQTQKRVTRRQKSLVHHARRSHTLALAHLLGKQL